jgi:hypothetical protein
VKVLISNHNNLHLGGSDMGHPLGRLDYLCAIVEIYFSPNVHHRGPIDEMSKMPN